MKVDILTFKVDGEPVGKQRPRILKSGRAYTPEKTVEYEARVLRSFLSASRGRFFAGKGEPVSVVINAYYKIPKSTAKAQRGLMGSGVMRPTKKPDADNIAKIIQDALNQYAYADDAQVVLSVASKWYAKDEPYVQVTLKKIRKDIETNGEKFSTDKIPTSS